MNSAGTPALPPKQPIALLRGQKVQFYLSALSVEQASKTVFDVEPYENLFRKLISNPRSKNANARWPDRWGPPEYWEMYCLFGLRCL